MFWRKYIYIVLFLILLLVLVFVGLYASWTIMYDKTTQDSWIHYLFIELPHRVIYITLAEEHLDSALIMIIIPVILFTIVLSFVSIMVLTVLVMLSLAKGKKQTHLTGLMNTYYRELIIDFMVTDSQPALKELEGAKTEISKKIIIGHLIDLKKNIIGHSADKLRTLFIHLHYDEYASKKLKSIFWHVKAENIRILSIMFIENATLKIAKFIDSGNAVLRMEAQLALVNLDREHPFYFLENLKHYLTDWHQLNIHDCAVRNSIKVPDFTIYLGSRNKSVTIFCLKMIGAFKQKMAYEKVTDLVKKPDDAISLQAIKTLGELKTAQTIKLFKEIYPHQNPEHKIAIIRSISKLKEDEAITFLIEKLYDEDFDIQMEASMALFKMQLENNTHLENVISETSNENLTTILKHLTDKRIK
jgi:hypothetical protein